MFQTISYGQLKSHAFYIQTSQAIVSLVHGTPHVFFSYSLGRTVLLPICTFPSSSGERDVSFTNLSRVPLGIEKYFEALKETISPILTNLTARHIAFLLQFFRFVLGDI